MLARDAGLSGLWRQTSRAGMHGPAPLFEFQAIARSTLTNDVGYLGFGQSKVGGPRPILGLGCRVVRVCGVTVSFCVLATAV